jgi:D-glycero-alpha-D-manno-heptose-7-phosphate kinase
VNSVTFAGGGTDMPEYFEKYGGGVVTTSINHFTYVIIGSRRDKSFQAFSLDYDTHQKTDYEFLEPQQGTEIAVSVVKHLKYEEGASYLIGSDVQPASGLGASSSLTVNFLKTITTLKEEKWSKEKIAEMAFYIGRNILNWPIGKQDEYISSFGGFNFIKFEKDKITVCPISLSKSTLQELEQNLVLFLIGFPKDHNQILGEQLRKTKEGLPEIIDALHFVRELADELYRSLNNSDITAMGEILHKGWLSKKKFVKNVSNERIDRIYEAALKEGATGGKITGAGGGGHILFYCEKPKQSKLIMKMEELGLKRIRFNFQSEGAKVINLYDFSK